MESGLQANRLPDRGTQRAWPDLIVALGMAILAIVAACSIFVQARSEVRALRTAP